MREIRVFECICHVSPTETKTEEIKAYSTHEAARYFASKHLSGSHVFPGRIEQASIRRGFLMTCVSFGLADFGQRLYIYERL